MVDLHRHDEFSTFDGFGKATELAKYAKELGYTAMGTSNHGNTNGLIQTYKACQEVGIKPILGVEGYFRPKLEAEGEEKIRKTYHLCLFAKDLQGYKNLNRIMYQAEEDKYYVGRISFDSLEKWNKGVICTSACIAGYLSQCLVHDKYEMAKKAALKFKRIFGEDFYIEIQPYKISESNDGATQEYVNEQLMILADECDIKCILTSDSHYGSPEDFPTYKKLHEIAKHTFYDIDKTYKERYMPALGELESRFVKMHDRFCREQFGVSGKKYAKQLTRNLEELESKVQANYLDELELELPEFIEGKDSYKVLVKKVKEGLKKRGKYNKKYVERCKQELEVIKYHGFNDYFLIVADYVNYAKDRGISVGPGRGSVCNSEVAYALGITEVDSLKFGLDFRRFLRKDKKKYPDIDLDFETRRRQEVIEYLLNRYEGHAAQISSYGLYKVDNLINDLAKVCGLDTTGKDIAPETKKYYKEEIASIKKWINKHMEDERFYYEHVMHDKKCKEYNEKYDNIILHFSKMFKKVRFIGTHAAGVAITGSKLLDYASYRLDKTKKPFVVYDLTDIESVNVIKFDILGLKTMEEIAELEQLTGVKWKEDWLDDPEVIEAFRNAETDGIFQFEKSGAKDILTKIDCDCFEDVCAVNAMNRPGPLSLEMPEQYANNKFTGDAKYSKYYEYTKDTYGTIIYQEQVQQIAINIGEMSWQDTDKIMKMMKGTSTVESVLAAYEKQHDELLEKFYEGASNHGYTKSEATELFDNMIAYTFNKGHAIGYAIIAVIEMYYKVHYPLEYWVCKLRAGGVDQKINDYKSLAVKSGCLIMPPNVNGTYNFEITELKGDKVIQEGISSIKGVGEKAAEVIVKYGPYIDYPDFEEKWQEEMSKEDKRKITQKTIKVLKEAGAFEFRDKFKYKEAIRYNRWLMAKSVSIR